MFRGEPAISEFVRHITSNHKSLDDFATSTHTVLQFDFSNLQPAHGQLTRFRVYTTQLHALLRLGFPSASRNLSVNLAVLSNSPAHSSIGTTSSALRQTPSVCQQSVSGSFNRVTRPSFHLSLAVLVHYRSVKIFSLGLWSAQIRSRVCRLQIYLGTKLQLFQFRIRDSHPLWSTIPNCSSIGKTTLCLALQPHE